MNTACAAECCAAPICMVRQRAPAFVAKAAVGNEIREVSLDGLKGKYVVLVFYPLDFTFVCPTELIAFSDRVKEFKDIGCEVLGISVDSEYAHLSWAQMPRNRGGLDPMKLPLVSDLDKSISRKYGVLVNNALSLRGLFIIDPKQTIRHVTINDDSIGRSVDETLRLVQAIQFVDKHGDVCPANWKPGARSMKADPKQSQDYFRQA